MKSPGTNYLKLGILFAFAGATLTACSPGEEGLASSETSEMHQAEGEETGHDMAQLPLPKRLAFMSGHVEAGLALYRAGEPEMATPHLLHPVSETHQAERKGLDELGFDAALFETVSKALEEGKAASEIEPQLKAAEANIAAVAQKAGGDPADIISYLMDVIIEEYSIAITDGKVSDPGEYQDAFGFAKVALDRAAALDADRLDKVREEILTLIALWPEAPIPPENPKPIEQVVDQAATVKAALSDG